MGSAVEDTMTGMQCAWCVNGSVFHCNDCNREHSNPTNDSKNSAMWHTNRKVLIMPLVILLMI